MLFFILTQFSGTLKELVHPVFQKNFFFQFKFNFQGLSPSFFFDYDPIFKKKMLG